MQIDVKKRTRCIMGKDCCSNKMTSLNILIAVILVNLCSSSAQQTTGTGQLVTKDAQPVSSDKPVVVMNIYRDDDDNISSKSRLKTGKLVNKPSAMLPKRLVVTTPDPAAWECPNITQTKSLECGCDLPHTLRCSGDVHGLELISRGLRESPFAVSMLDCTLKNVSILSESRLFENISLHGLVISSGEIKKLHRLIFDKMKTPLYELGLPNNALDEVPAGSLQPLHRLDRLDVSKNKIKMLQAADFIAVPDLTYLDLGDNQISSISPRSFAALQRLTILKLNGNRLGDVPSSIQALGKCSNLRELDLRANVIRGPLHTGLLPTIKSLRSLNLDKNIIGSIHTGAFQSFPNLVMLSVRYCQIDVLEDHAFAGLGALQELDLSNNGIVSISDASLRHLPRLLVLDLKHNFLRAVTAEMVSPLPSLKELRLDGNDISIVHADALKNVTSLKNLSLLNNPLACDCNLRPFAEWIYKAQVPNDNLLGAICATPPRLEGAPLLQIPVESLTCDQQDDEPETLVEQMNNTFINDNQSFTAIEDLSDEITLKEVHLSIDYGLLMTWQIAKPVIDEYRCNTLFIFEKFGARHVLRNSSPSNCEYNKLNNPNAFTVIIPEGFDFSRGDLYKFCLTLISTDSYGTLIFGCSDYVDVMNVDGHHRTINTSRARSIGKAEGLTDISTFEEIAEVSTKQYHEEEPEEELIQDDLEIKRRVLVALGVGILLASICIVIVAICKWHAKKRRPTTICHSVDSEYVKLQATTTL